MESDTVFRRTCLGSVLSNVPPRDIVTVKNWAKSIDHRVCLFMCGGVLSERGVTLFRVMRYALDETRTHKIASR